SFSPPFHITARALRTCWGRARNGKISLGIAAEFLWLPRAISPIPLGARTVCIRRSRNELLHALKQSLRICQINPVESINYEVLLIKVGIRYGTTPAPDTPIPLRF